MDAWDISSMGFGGFWEAREEERMADMEAGPTMP